MAVRSAQRVLALCAEQYVTPRVKIKTQGPQWFLLDYLYQSAVQAYAELRRP